MHRRHQSCQYHCFLWPEKMPREAGGHSAGSPSCADNPFTNLINDKGEIVYPATEWPDFRKETDKVNQLNISQARMINHQAKGIFADSLESLLAAKGERVLLMEVCCSPESFLSAEVA